MEKWKSVPGFPDYAVSDQGNVRRTTPSRRRPVPGVNLKPRAGTKGHLYVNLRKDNRAHSKYVHRLVLEAFVGPAPKGAPCAAHGNGDPSDNRLENLRWASYAENSADSIKHGTSSRPSGFSHVFAKLTPEKLRLARKMNEEGMSFRAIGRHFGVSHVVISNALKRRTYRDAKIRHHYSTCQCDTAKLDEKRVD